MDSSDMSSTYASGLGGSNTTSSSRPSAKPPKKLTIERPTKIEIEQAKKRFYKHRPSRSVVCLKWISTFVLAILLLAFVILSKVSAIAISENMHRNAEKNGDTQEACRNFVMLFLIVLIPNCLNFIRGIWAGFFRKDIPWPKKTALFWGFIISAIETFGICIFVMKIPGLTQPRNVILLMNCVILIPVFIALVKALCISERQSLKKALFFGLALLLGLVGVGSTGYIWSQNSSISLNDVWYPFAGVICLSVAWLPEVQSYLLKTKTEVVGSSTEPLVQNYSYTGSDETIPKRVVEGQDNDLDESSGLINVRNSVDSSQPKLIAQEKSTWKMVIYMSFCKILFTFVFSFVILQFSISFSDTDASSDHFRKGWYGWQQKGIYYFIANCCSSPLGYVVGFIACTTCMQKGSYVLPLLLATPVAAVLFAVKNSCNGLLFSGITGKTCDLNVTLDVILFCGAVFCTTVAHVLSFGYLIINSHFLVKQNEAQLFWLPTYNSGLLEQWLFLATRNEHNDDKNEDPVAKAKRSRVIICTTMYREADYEMRQLLESINNVNLARGEGQRHFESHIFFDGAVKDRNLTDFVLQLVALVHTTLGLQPEECSKMITPYGMSLSWKLKGEHGMVFRIHLKDNFKVKNKKRWSQIMYMSFVLDYLMLQLENATDDETFILTTDADVRFTPDAVEALLDLMTRDPSVGAVCARTHPLGSGPIVWYQVFEYALGHWFQKAAEHVIGSVLCSPGCFSVYRCKAVKDVLSKYASNVEHAFEFLTKDMGEDRWLCTLMVQTGWRIEYCAASENSTHCPEEFDEFYKQRRRWVASTLANMMLLMKEWSTVAKFNHRVTIVFLLYQATLLFATLIGPSSVILVVTGGLVYGWNINTITSLVIQILICVGYTWICLYTSQKTQLGAAKFLTFIYSVIMTAVVVGTAVQVAKDFSKGAPMNPSETNATSTTTTMNPNAITKYIHVSTTTIYLLTMAGIFLLAGILHLKECLYLVHGIWYLLCLPSGYLVLLIYSVCNITDRSWGTREAQSKTVVTTKSSWQKTVQDFYRTIFFCCFQQPPSTSTVSTQTVPNKQRTRKDTGSSDGDPTAAQIIDLEQSGDREDINKSTDSRFYSVNEDRLSTVLEFEENPTPEVSNEEVDEEDDVDSDTVIDVYDWLPSDLRDKYSKLFRDNGYDNTMLISGMTEKELKDIGIKTKGTKQKLLQEIQLLPDYDIVAEVPENVRKWLEIIGLSQYRSNFEREQIRTSKEMEVLKSFGRNEIEKELKIKKKGHVKRLLYAIRRLRNPTEDERRIIDTMKAIDRATTHQLKRINAEEYDFWERLKNKCLLPSSTAFGLEEDLKQKLGDLRNQWLMVFAISNALWLILISTLANQGQLLNVFGSNIVGFVVLVLFTFVLLIQFLAMIVHRVGTLTHFLGRAPYRINEAYRTSWAFNDSDINKLESIEADEREARQALRRAKDWARKRLLRPKKKRTTQVETETQPLINHPQRRQRDSMV